jgi:hypothetical protein
LLEKRATKHCDGCLEHRATTHCDGCYGSGSAIAIAGRPLSWRRETEEAAAG